MTSAHEDVERALLGAVLVRPELLGAAADIITPADFDRVKHRLIWEALLRLDEDDRPLDLVTLRAELTELGRLEAAGGVPYLAGLTDGVPNVGEKAVEEWARLVRERSRLRSLADGLRALVRSGGSRLDHRRRRGGGPRTAAHGRRTCGGRA